jgi:transcriptional regulator of arginine metabolism
MTNNQEQNTKQDILKDLRQLLLHGVSATQETICMELEAMGHRINQSKVSRLLRKVNAIKVKNEMGEMIYHLPHDATPPEISTVLSDLVIDIVANEAMIIIKTSPGSASLIARIIDHKKCAILGTIAGDDSIFVAPESIKDIEKNITLIRSYLSQIDAH